MKKDYSNFFGQEWAQFLAPFLESREYENIGANIISQIKQGIEITPGLKNIFRGFKECPWHLLHTIIIGQDVYPGKTEDGNLVADGIAFSSNTSTDPPSWLNSIFEAIDVDIYQGDYSPVFSWNQELHETVCDLSSWSNQGILLINCALTTVVGRPNEHIPIWRPFIEYVVRHVTKERDSLGIVLLGSQARQLRGQITNGTHFVAHCEHPATTMYQKRSWQHNSVFKALDNFQKHKNNITIKW